MKGPQHLTCFTYCFKDFKVSSLTGLMSGPIFEKTDPHTQLRIPWLFRRVWDRHLMCSHCVVGPVRSALQHSSCSCKTGLHFADEEV